MNNREIKFRIWYPYCDGGEMVKDVWIDLEQGSVLSDNDDLCEREGHSGAVLMQYTGLKDKNGKEIYEGDIIKEISLYDNVNDSIKNYKNCVVGYLQGSFRVEIIRGLDAILLEEAVFIKNDIENKIEIIGNIYENKNLIK